MKLKQLDDDGDPGDENAAAAEPLQAEPGVPWREKQWGAQTVYTCIHCDTDFWTPGECAEHARTQHGHALHSPGEFIHPESK